MESWDHAEADFELWHYQATTSDFCEEGDMRKPTKQMVRDTMAALDRAQPEWRQLIGGNAFMLEIVKRYPQLEKRRTV